jgi:ABC-type Zn uptake system ZnuABC Zn-binding protein ZnuA
MSYEAIRERLNQCREEHKDDFSENEKLLLDSLEQLTNVLESDLTQIKVALGHVARLLETHRE